VYSTCSVSMEENEGVVNYALNNRYVKLVETGLEVGDPGICKQRERRFHPSTKLCKRVYPHTHNMDGFFVAKFRKFADGVKSVESVTTKHEEQEIRAVKRDKKRKENQKKKEKRTKKKAKKEQIADKIKEEKKAHKEAVKSGEKPAE